MHTSDPSVGVRTLGKKTYTLGKHKARVATRRQMINMKSPVRKAIAMAKRPCVILVHTTIRGDTQRGEPEPQELEEDLDASHIIALVFAGPMDSIRGFL